MAAGKVGSHTTKNYFGPSFPAEKREKIRGFAGAECQQNLQVLLAPAPI
jgi:hypothetical protein